MTALTCKMYKTRFCCAQGNSIEVRQNPQAVSRVSQCFWPMWYILEAMAGAMSGSGAEHHVTCGSRVTSSKP